MKLFSADNRTKKSTINASAEIVGQLTNIILSFVSRTVFIHTLGSAYLGINGLFADILRMLSLTEMGLDTAINFKLYKPLAEKDTQRLQILMKFYATAYRIIAAVFVVLGICIIPFLPFLIKDYDTLPDLNINATLIFLLYIAQSASSYLFSASKAAIIKADQKMYITTIIGTIVNIFKNLTQILILIVFNNFTAYTAITIVFVIVQNIIIAVIAKKMYPIVFRYTEKRISKAEVKDTIKDLGALFVYKVNSVVIKATDNLVLSSFIGLVTVGLYSNYLLIYSAISVTLSKIYSSVKASMGNLFATESLEKQYSFFEFSNYISVIIFGTACIGMTVCCNDVISLWLGSEYIIAQPLPLLIGIELFFAGIKLNLGQIRTVTGLYRQMWFRPIIGIIINIVVSISLVFKFKIYGVIFGTIASDFFANFLIDPKVIHHSYFKDMIPVAEYYKKNAKYFLLVAFVGAADYLLCSLINTPYTVINLLLHFIICACSFPGICLLIYKNAEENKYLFRIIKKILSKKHKAKKGE
jgi:O-antigen/teichoic acid export membrane protein